MERKGKQGSFDRRAFAATMAATSGLALVLTGLGTHTSHHDTAQGGYHGWLASHLLVALVFTLSGVWHGVLNGRVLTKHMVRREAVLATAVVLALLGVGALHGRMPH